MPRPFESLSEKLLRDGVAPRHVRRYVRELEDHLDDLIAMQKARGYDGEDADLRARALLGPDEELAEAMTGRPEFRSLAARAPWLVFGVVPPVLIVAVLTSVGFVMVGLWHLLGGRATLSALPLWAETSVRWWCTLANFGAGPLVAVFLVIVAIHYRRRWRWPAFAVGLTGILSAFTTFTVRFPVAKGVGEISVGFMVKAPIWENLARLSLTMAAVSFALLLIRRRPMA